MNERENLDIPEVDVVEITPDPVESPLVSDSGNVIITFPPQPYEVIIKNPSPVEGESGQIVEYPQVQLVDRPFFTTSFEDYSVSEGLTLTLILIIFAFIIYSIIKGGFRWLR